MKPRQDSSVPTKSARALLVSWANEQDHWARGIVAEVLETRRALPQERVTFFFTVLLAEKELSAEAKSQIGPLVWDERTPEKTEPLRLVALEGVEGVNALSSGQTLAFNARVTVIFGENGAGKTGYVRILKRVANVRTAEEVLCDFRASSPIVAPKALIKYAIGAQEAELAWEGAAGVHPLTRLDVFDSRAVDLHVDDDLTYVYTPNDISLFRYVHDALEAVKAALESARQTSAIKGNPFLSRFSCGTDMFAKIESLGATTDIAELKGLANVTADEERERCALTERASALRSETPDARAKVLRSRCTVLRAVLQVVQVFQGFDLEAYERQRAALTLARVRHSTAIEAAFEAIGIEGVLSDTWRAFIHAGEQHIRSLEAAADYPTESAPCVYCQQPLTCAAVALVQKLREYADGQLRKNVEICTEAFRSTNQSFETAGVALASAVKAEAPDLPFLTPLLSVLVTYDRVRAMVLAKDAIDVDIAGCSALVAPVLDSLSEAILEAERLVAALSGQADARAALAKETAARQRLLDDRILLRDWMNDIERYVAAVKWTARAQAYISSRFPPLLRSLTEVSKAASERLLNQDFEVRFRVECEALRAPMVRLDFPGKKGQPARRKVLAPGHRLSDILSEGEQKALALADFLAEAGLKGNSTPIVFDDPVTSLDYKRHLHVVDRLVAMSHDRQVIVFTHNIWFASELLGRFEKETQRKHCSYYSVGGVEGTKGVISKGTHPRADTFGTMKGRLNALLQDAGKQEGETLEAMIERGYGILRGVCEVVVETDLLQGVVQRYQPNIRMTCLEQIATESFATTAKTLAEIFERACRVIEAHSQPMETLNVRPSLADLRADWVSVEKARQSYLEAVKLVA